MHWAGLWLIVFLLFKNCWFMSIAGPNMQDLSGWISTLWIKGENMKMEKRPTSDQSWRGFTTRGNHQQPRLLCSTVYSHLLRGRVRKMQKKSKKYLIETKDDYTIQPAFKRTVQLKILCSNEVSWSRNGARCLSNTSCGPKSAPKTPPKYWGGKRQ